LNKIWKDFLALTTTADRWLILCLALITCLSWFIVIRKPDEKGASIKITYPQGELVLPIQNDTTLAIPGFMGLTAIEIKGSNVNITNASCPDKICQKMGPIPQKGQFIICIPNGIIIQLLSEEAQFDAISPAAAP